MNNMIRRTAQTSVEAYHMLDKSTSYKKILFIIHQHPGVSRQDIQRISKSYDYNLTINNICGRVRELLDDGIIVEAGEKKDRITNKTVKRLYPIHNWV